MSELEDELTVGEDDRHVAEGVLAFEVRDGAHGNVPAGRPVARRQAFLAAERRAIAKATLLLEVAGLGGDEVNRARADGRLRATGVAQHGDETDGDGGGGDCESDLRAMRLGHA